MELGLDGQVVTAVSADFTASLITSGGYDIRIETDFSLHTTNGNLDVQLGAGSVDDKVLESLLGQTVASSIAEDSGVLVLMLSNEASVRVEPDSDYEAWTVAGPNGQKIVCMPGGELAIWPEGDN